VVPEDAGPRPPVTTSSRRRGVVLYAWGSVARRVPGRRGALRARTIHAVKGESYDATLTVAISTDRFDNVADWLAGGEERRIAYVALTRAKSYSAVAVPESCDPATSLRLRQGGFRRLPRTPA
jgi:hypothetical protein